jgi:hypothetical protein
LTSGKIPFKVYEVIGRTTMYIVVCSANFKVGFGDDLFFPQIFTGGQRAVPLHHPLLHRKQGFAWRSCQIIIP